MLCEQPPHFQRLVALSLKIEWNEKNPSKNEQKSQDYRGILLDA